MSTTLSLNSDDSIMVTTYFGGQDRGRCHTFRVKSGDRIFVMDGTENELVEALMNYFEIEVESGNVMPMAENRRGPLIQKLDPELEKLLDEEEEIAKRTKQKIHPGDELVIHDIPVVVEFLD